MKPKICIFLVLSFISGSYLRAQDYLITFEGSGESTTVSSVIVSNLTQGTEIEMDGSKVLHLVAVLTDVEPISDSKTAGVVFYPNPMKDYTKMLFTLTEPSETIITFYDLSGKKILIEQDFLMAGPHTYKIEGLAGGIYVASVRSGKYFFSGRLVTSGSQGSTAKMVYENQTVPQEMKISSKGINEDIMMQYNDGDLLQFTGISGNYTSIITDTPEESKIIMFNFIECTDGDGNDYPVVETGKGDAKCPKQFWMGANLKTTRYNDKTPVNLVSDENIWSRLGTGAMCWYNNNEDDYKDIYGALYNWYSAGSEKLCPVGWHVPTDHDWTILIYYLDGSSVAGGKLKETGTDHWLSPNTGATNISGFTALPGSYRKEDGLFHTSGDTGLWWSATENDTQAGTAWSRAMFYNNDDVKRTYHNTKSGLSVRCVKDN